MKSGLVHKLSPEGCCQVEMHDRGRCTWVDLLALLYDVQVRLGHEVPAKALGIRLVEGCRTSRRPSTPGSSAIFDISRFQPCSRHGDRRRRPYLTEHLMWPGCTADMAECSTPKQRCKAASACLQLLAVDMLQGLFRKHNRSGGCTMIQAGVVGHDGGVPFGVVCRSARTCRWQQACARSTGSGAKVESDGR